jgi:hypothetical protein
LGGHCCSSLGIAHPSGAMEVDYLGCTVLGAKGEYTPVHNQRAGAWQPFLSSVKFLKFLNEKFNDFLVENLQNLISKIK